MKKSQKFIVAMVKRTERALCVMNGIFGDTLEEKETGLAMQMTLYHENEPLPLTKREFMKKNLPPSGKICVLAHGSCGSEKGWGFKGNAAENYGSLLQKDFGYTPFFLRYNSGLHISTNGQRFSHLLEKMVRHYPTPVSEILLVGHSMGGLLFRSACHYGQQDKREWVKKVQKIFYLGSPHLGTHLERLGKLTTAILKRIPNPVTKIIVSLGDLRSNGVKDLRHGYLTHEDWQAEKADHLFYWPQNKIPLLPTANHYLICGTLAKKAESKMGRFFGDGLVHTASGTGKGFFPSSAIPFVEDHCKVISGISHARLQKSRRVYEQMKAWCR